MLVKFLVKFKHYPHKVTVPLDYIRLTKDQFMQNEKRKAQLLNGGDAGADQAIGEFQFPEHLRQKRSDTDKVKLQKKKKVKALKYNYKQKLIEQESKSRQSTWTDFTNKAVKQKAGHFAFNKDKESMFKSPDTITGKVGVIGSGNTMTDYEANKIKYQQVFKNGKQDLKELESMSSLAKRKKYN